MVDMLMLDVITLNMSHCPCKEELQEISFRYFGAHFRSNPKETIII